MHVLQEADSKMIITIKTNRQDLRSIVASLERFNYEILEVHSLLNNEMDVQDNYESFMKYINI